MQSEATTHDRILDAAEALFAEQGFESTSIRAITAAAGANLAAVNYHFQSKETLIHAVLARRLDPVNDTRLSMLDAILAQSDGAPPDLDGILHAFARPIFEAAFGLEANPAFARLAGRISSEPGDSLRKLAFEHIRPVAHRFFRAFALALPDLPPVDLIWRIHLSIGAMFHLLAASDFICEISNGIFQTPDVETALLQWVTHTRAALLAPAAKSNLQQQSQLKAAG
ncbi:MAG: TetR/AcrR family transcriptional regulator [Bryobacteraceae bacterium]